MSPLAAGARHVVVVELGAPATSRSATEVAAAIVRAWETLATHFARLVGTDGIQTILDRSVILGRKQHVWLESEARKTVTTTSGWPSLERSLATQLPELAIEAFIALLEIVAGLLGRFIGDELVARMLREVWPEAQWHGLKELP